MLEALRDQLGEDRLEGLTVESVAEAAGVSRRTFFNYFASLEAALAEGMSSPITTLTEAFAARPLDEPPLVAMQRTIEVSPVPHELLAWIAAVRCTGQERHGLALNIWSYHRDWLEGLLRDRVPEGDPLAASGLAGTVMAIFEAAERHWIQTAGDVVDERSAAEFNRLLHRGLQFAATGWTQTD
nr:TetR/AcrR family transcriptional regulator [Ornithinimicrobium sp. F0845]